MINSYMSQSEILSEFWKDYVEVIRPRCFRVAERKKKDLGKRKNPDWIRLKDIMIVRASGNVYSVILSVSYPAKKNTAIKTSCWCSYLDSKTGVRKTLLLPAQENQSAVILFTSGFFKEWNEQQGMVGSEDPRPEFFKWANGNYQVYHNSEDRGKIEIDLNGLGAGLGKYREPGEYEFQHFMGDSLIKDMQSKVGEILDPLELWEAYYNRKPEVVLRPEDDPEYDYWKTETEKALDEIFEKYG